MVVELEEGEEEGHGRCWAESSGWRGLRTSDVGDEGRRNIYLAGGGFG